MYRRLSNIFIAAVRTFFTTLGLSVIELLKAIAHPHPAPVPLEESITTLAPQVHGSQTPTTSTTSCRRRIVRAIRPTRSSPLHQETQTDSHPNRNPNWPTRSQNGVGSQHTLVVSAFSGDNTIIVPLTEVYQELWKATLLYEISRRIIYKPDRAVVLIEYNDGCLFAFRAMLEGIESGDIVPPSVTTFDAWKDQPGILAKGTLVGKVLTEAEIEQAHNDDEFDTSSLLTGYLTGTVVYERAEAFLQPEEETVPIHNQQDTLNDLYIEAVQRETAEGGGIAAGAA